MKRWISLALCLMLAMSVLPLSVSAAPTVAAYDDGTIYVGGIYDMWAQITEGADRAAYQWQVSVGADDYYGSDAWYDIQDLAGDYGYKGTKTSHLQIVGKANDDSVAIGSGWENMKFRCKITLDGKDYFTKGLSELRHNTATFNAVVKAGNYKLYEPKVQGASQMNGSGSSYTAKATAGQELTFQISCKNVTDTRLVASEFTCTPEIWITDGDTTVHAEEELKYTPTKANSQFTVEFKLRMKIGVNDLGYTETKAMTVSTYLPGSIGSGTAKSRMLIYTAPSTGSKRLATVATGNAVDIVEKVNDNWYKVSYNDKVGYAQAADMTAVVTQTVKEVKTYLPAPTVGQKARFDATYATAGVGLYKIEPVSWYDVNESRFLTAGDTFKSGHSYTLSIWMAAADGYRFQTDSGGKPNVTGYVNDSVVSVYRVTGEDPQKVIELSWTYTPKEVTTHTHTPSGWRSVQEYHYKVCTTCGDMLQQEEHVGGEPTCAAKGICEVCGASYGVMTNDHKWSPTYLYQNVTGHAWICADCKTNSTIEKHEPGPAATDTTPQTCKACGYVIQPAKNHKHNLTKVPQTPATCVNEGNIEYYRCDGCNDLFTDGEGKNKIPETMSVAVGALGHTITDLWNYDAQCHWRSCATCRAVLDETKMFHDTTADQCATCGYVIGSGETTPTEPTEEEPVITIGQITQPGKPYKSGWKAVALVSLVCFAAAVTATVIILKMKKKGEQL